MGRINQLDDGLSNMIAAGEVVENMASVVKELVENSIDAEASNIDIFLADAGLSEIRVSDDGYGMSQEDLKMAIKRHATSKIKTAHDLYHIHTLGFRGEALPSIASVSHFDITSSEGDEGYHLFMLKGELKEEGKVAAKKGTIISVKYLFYNTPARLKHLRASQTELSFIVDYVQKIALSHPQISFKLTNNQKILFQSSSTEDPLKVLAQIYPLDIIKNMIPFEAKNTYFDISGYATKPMFTRSNRQHITVIVNDRLIKNNRIVQAVKDGYDTYLPVGKNPIVFLKITLDPLLIDVNIHPQKLEVKFTEESSLRTLIRRTINQALLKEELIPKVQKQERKVHDVSQYSFDLKESDKINEETIAYQAKKDQLVEQILSNRNKKSEDLTAQIEQSLEDVHDEPVLKKPNLPRLEYIGQYKGTYLLAQSEQGLYMIDQHAAAERIRYERYIEKMSSPKIETYELIIPITLDLSSQEVIALEGQLDQLEQFGIKAIDNAHQGIDITHVPTWFAEGYEGIYTEEMVSHLLDYKDLSIKSVVDHLAKELSCKHSIRANKYINKEEIEVLLKDLSNAKNPYTCPHGRPVIIHFTPEEIEKMFKRIMS
jgi:DNA mismatch repair protein MutL